MDKFIRESLFFSKAIFKITFFDAKMRFWPQKLSSKLHFSMQKCDTGLKSLLQKLAVPRDAPRALRGAQWRVPLGRKTRHIFHLVLSLCVILCNIS